jgi:hypothetical protein
MFLVIVVRKAKLQQLSHKIANIISNNIIWLIKYNYKKLTAITFFRIKNKVFSKYSL